MADSVRRHEGLARWHPTTMMQSIYRLAAEGRVENDWLAGLESGVTGLADRARSLSGDYAAPRGTASPRSAARVGPRCRAR